MKVSLKKKKFKNNKTARRRKARQFADIAKLSIKAFLILITIATGATIYYKYSNLYSKYVDQQFANFSSKFGLTLENVYLEGQVFVSKDTIIRSIGVQVGDPILAIPLDKIKKKLEKNSWIKHAVIDRQLPNTIYIGIVERNPIAIGQYNGKLFLIDDEGKRIQTKITHKFTKFPVIIGDNVESEFLSLFPIINKKPALYKKITSIIWVGDRRWNIRLSNAIEIKLPENNIEKAWNKVIKLYKSGKVEQQKLKSIDLRVPGKIFFEKNI
jgi:cell division protein FtsQ